MAALGTPVAVALALVGLGLLAALIGILRHAPRQRLVLAALQLLVAGALAAALALPPRGADEVVHVLTAGADAAQAAALAADAARVALPDAPADAEAWRVPDLATALRMHPGTSRWVVHGHGLDAHDRATASTRPIDFEGEAPQGIVAIDHPDAVRPGALWPVEAQLRLPDTQGVVLQLRDPAGLLLDEAAPDARGRARLWASVPAAGRHELRLEARRGEDLLEGMPLAVFATVPATMQGLLLAGAPSPELRALRRWAEDAGLDLDARFRLAPTLALGDAPARIDAAKLAELDLLVLDERSLVQRTEVEREAIAAAVRDGLGLLIRIGAPPDEAATRALRALGSGVGGEAESTAEVLLPAPWQSAVDRQPLHAWPLADPAPGAADLLRARDGASLGWWRAQGEGRVGVLLLTDSYRLATRGDARAHADLWSSLWLQLARAGGKAMPTVTPAPVAGQASRICGGEGELVVEAPGGSRMRLLRDPVADGCARWLPMHGGWHQLRGDGDAGEAMQPIHVADPSQRAAVLAESRYRHTLGLARGEPDAPASMAASEPGWPPLRDRTTWMLLALLFWAGSACLERRLRRLSPRVP